LIGANLAVFRPAPQSAIADLQLGTGFGAPRASGDGLVDQSNCGLAMWGADHASSSPPPPDRMSLFSENEQRGRLGQSAALARQFFDPFLLFLRRLTKARSAGAIPIVCLFTR